MPVAGAVIGAIGAIGGGAMGMSAAESAAGAQKDAAQISSDIQWRMYKRSRQDMLPFMEAAKWRLPWEKGAFAHFGAAVSRGPGKFEDSDYYKTLQGSLDQAGTALGKRAAARGGGVGSIGRDMAEYAVPLAGQMRGNWINEWMQTQVNPWAQAGGVGQIGQSGPASQMGMFGSQVAGNMGANAQYAGQAQASGYLGQSAALQNMIGGGLNALGQAYGSYNPQQGAPFGAGAQQLSNQGYYDQNPSQAPGSYTPYPG